MNWNYFTFAKTHAGKVRPYNEDALLDMTEQHIWVVADGMGGHSAGDIASQMLVDRIARHMQDVPNTNIDDIRAAVQQANFEIYQYAQMNLDGKTMGTTLVLLFIQDGYYHCLWVGDSRIYQLRNGTFVQKTRDHSQVMELVEQGLLAFEDAESHPLANVITRAVGVDEMVTIDQVSGQLADGDQFLLCSDGLSKELSCDEMHKTLCADSVNQAGLALMHSALVRGASDNVTCALIKVRQEQEPSEFDSARRDDATIPVFLRGRV
ncbi:TPA: serine/threonine-protein phosphatase [Vibrio parahaemolyticus]|uniref:Protein phosphatase 2C domain-containing protein n=16 Tax=Vibrio TaxID=662 RepID=A0AA46UMW3_VIBPH|nr:protein phosphatase 2C domain-containing protein [Vibrio parahaemolyticus]EGR1736640.1 serine/threonine-protein phosphatase [Vibrio parahaemolyticus]EGX7689066.1 serine/threonine-protein phosphatase [Vibrio parahaemolyticus]EIC5073610.1 serine/threonine-protein phosphatase [Vibrio parahaemolyticus]ELZ1714806.1 serine/threonine-protein phosphatase [Vibrio parahaemolyticus]EXJ49471.1 phosphatase 2C family protein [Vibrio parahaemolyticus VPTS-2010_2]